MIQQGSRFEKPSDTPLVSIVLPLYNESAILERLVASIDDAVAANGYHFEYVFVNDGSQDDSAEVLDRLANRDARIRVVHFSRNFGHQAAVQAGLLHARGDAVVIMDSDMQDDPVAIPRFLEKWREGFQVVYAVRVQRKESWLKRSLFSGFYRLLNTISQIPIPKDAGNFGLVDRTVAVHIAHLCDRDRFFPGLRRWVGFRQVGVPVERHKRHDDTPRISLRGLWRLAKSAIFSFSAFPLTMFYAIAAVALLLCFGLVGFTLYHKLFTGLAIPGWTSITLTASFFGALNALGIGILGEYVTRIYDQVRARPLFIVARKVNIAEAEEATVGAALHWPDKTWSGVSDSQSIVEP